MKYGSTIFSRYLVLSELYCRHGGRGPLHLHGPRATIGGTADDILPPFLLL
jgi:hypothetical protein